VTRDAAPLIAADADGVGKGFEQALCGRQPPFETARFGRCHGDSIDVEFFCELTIALSTWRQTGYLLHAIGHSQITRLAAGHSPLSRPHPVELEP